MEILLRRHTRLSGDAKADRERLKAEDVVVIMPDGHPWTQRELTNPDWRIIRVPGLSEEVAKSMIEPDEQNNKPRKKSFNVSGGLSNFWNDDTRQNPIIEISVPPEGAELLLKERSG